MVNLSKKQPVKRALPALSMGNIVSIAAQISQTHWQIFFVKSLLAYLWLFLALGGAAVVMGLSTLAAVFASGNEPMVLFPTVIVSGVALLPIVGYATARFIATGGVLSRLTFNVIHDQAEPEAASRQFIYGRTWAYLRGALWLGLILLMVYAGMALLAYVLWLTIIPLLDAIQADVFYSDVGPLLLLLGGILGILVFLGIGALVP